MRKLLLIGLPVLVVVLVAAAVLTRAGWLPIFRPPAAAPPPPTITTTVPPTTTTAAPPTTTTPAAPDPLAPGAAQAAVAAVDAQDTGSLKFGVAVLDRASGQETDGADAAAQFDCASVLKLFLITDVLHQAEQGAVTVGPAALDQIHRALTISDDSAMNALWGEYHGADAIQQLIGLAGLRDTVVTPAARGGFWGGVLISARDVLAVYQYVLTSLSPADRDLVISTLNNAQAVGYQGFDQGFGLLGPTRTASTKAKQGWMGYQHLTMLHSTGVLDSGNQVLVAILSSRAGGGYATARTQLNSAATALVKALGPKAIS
jgi:hypothetical protein